MQVKTHARHLLTIPSYRMTVMFEIDEISLPFVRTRHALLAIDLQNDFISSDATIPVPDPPNFVDKITNLASNFRGFGNVIWIRTVFESSRPVNVDGTSESVITDAELPTSEAEGHDQPKWKGRPSQKLVERFAKLVEAEAKSSEEVAAAATSHAGEEDTISETYLTLGSGEKPRAVSQSSTGSNFHDSVVRHVVGQKDLFFQKTYYSAFKDGSLVQILRAKFVTEIYLCGALTNISVFATAMDAARHGYAITIVDDCLGYRSKARHEEALRKLVEFTGCNMISSMDLIQNIKERENAQRLPKPSPSRTPLAEDRSKGKGSDINALLSTLNLGSDVTKAARPSAAPTGSAKSVAAEPRGSSESPASTEQDEDLKLPSRTATSEVKRERVKSKVKTRRRHSKSGTKDTTGGEPSGSSSIEKSSSATTSATSVVISQASGKTTLIISETGGDVEPVKKHKGKLPYVHTIWEPRIPRIAQSAPGGSS